MTQDRLHRRTSLLVCGIALFAVVAQASAGVPSMTLVIESIADEPCTTGDSESPRTEPESVLALEEIGLAGDRKLSLDELETPAGWRLSREKSGNVLEQLEKCARPLEVPITGDWVRLRIAAHSQGARVRLGAVSRWIERQSPGSSPITVELGARIPSHQWESPHLVPYQRSLSELPAIRESPSERPRRIVFNEQRSLDPSPVLPATTASLPATIEFTDIFIPGNATLRVGLDVENQSRISVEVEAFTQDGSHLATKRVSIRPNTLEPDWVEIPLKNAHAGRGDLQLRISADGLGAVRVVDPKIRGLKPIGPARNKRPNVILVTLDTVRADHLSLYGYSRPTTPFLDSISNELLVFDNAYSQVPATRPSHYSILSSRYPRDIGIWSNDGPPLPRSELTLAEVLHSAGWRTGAVVSVDFLMLQSGLDQGFDRIDRPNRKGERLGEATTEAAVDFIEQSADSPFFLWIHYFDAHLPYQPLPEYRGLFWEGPPPTASDIAPDLIEKEGFGTVQALPHLGYMTAMYDASLRYLDDQMQSLYKFLQAADLLDQTIIVIAADHGESLGEKGVYFAHDGLYEPTVRVPLILRIPDGRRTGRVGDVVENLDIAATVLELTGLKTPASFRGLSLLAQKPGDDQAIFEHTGRYFIGIRRGALKWIDATRFRSEERFTRTNLRELQTAPAISLFDLDSDPLETTNLADSQAQDSKILRSTLERWLQDDGQESSRHPEVQPVDPVLRESLRALGYAE